MDAPRGWLRNHFSSASRVPSSIRLGPLICRPSKIVCIGLNYRDGDCFDLTVDVRNPTPQELSRLVSQALKLRKLQEED
jgi:hypothetical protein